jgi:GNAT superfamily N-acetyltransferase
MSTSATFRFTPLSGSAIAAHLSELARLRITVFREFPYLYDGSEEYERRYLKTYVDSPRSLVLLVHEGDTLIGATTGLPLADETEEFQRPFMRAGYDLQRVFYCGESVLDARYRGRGVYKHLFAARESHARALGGFDWCTFCAVQRAADHPLRPADYQPLYAVWQHFGYSEQAQLETTFTWQDIDQPAPSAKPMRFWLKALTPS